MKYKINNKINTFTKLPRETNEKIKIFQKKYNMDKSDAINAILEIFFTMFDKEFRLDLSTELSEAEEDFIKKMDNIKKQYKR